MSVASVDEQHTGAPARAGLVLLALILVAAVANLNLAVANVALPDIGKAFDASQTSLNLAAVGYSLGLAGSVLYFGALGDRYGRKTMCVGGVLLSIPVCLVAAYAPNMQVLIIARILGGLSAGMAYPTTLALITALWAPGAGRTKSIALWSALGGAIAALGPLVAGGLLEHFWWGSVFLITLPLAVVALVLAVVLLPAHVNEGTEPVDNLGGVLSALLVAALILAINFAPVPDKGALVLSLAVIAIAAGIAFFLRQRRVANPLYDLAVASRPTFWVAAVAGIIVFGSLMGAMYIGQQFLQNVLEYSTIDSGAAILPAAIFMVLVAPQSAKIIEARGARFTLLCGYVFMVLGFLTMLLLWDEGIPYWKVGLAYGFVGIGVGLAGTPASHSLTGSVPVRQGRHGVGYRRPPARSRRRHHAVDLRRAPHRGLRVGGEQSGSVLGEQQRAVGAHQVLLERGQHRDAVSAVRQPDHRRRPPVLPRRCRLGVSPRASSPSSPALSSSTGASRSAMRRRRSSRSIATKTVWVPPANR